MARTILTALCLLAAVALPGSALALTLETPLANPDGTSNFNDPKYDRFKDNLSSGRDDNGNDNSQPRGLTFGSPNSGAGSFSFGFGPAQNPNDPFNNSRFFRPPPPGNNN
jgi:hypothetical protein